ncbi:N(2)-fixation sustaining protein CowN [Rhodomicrobium lacus]|jgi:uncharacterized protein YqeY|uniref:N(2)-fixation sustaining protein CowN n=1 Tax=Rhodomicrobium TaxID=1068 RepID=UPI000F8C868B|nr:N(2)-fixation sustaining protein CowN [Rhodomicrobium lacus]WKW52293.1 N(2)-fixation sustaining protein CowN [Rhodomicrobium lacus]
MSEQIDRYVSFKNIDCNARAEKMMDALQPYIEAAENPFWAYFQQKRAEFNAKGYDDLRVLHNYLPTLKELIEDDELLSQLEDLEYTCM